MPLIVAVRFLLNPVQTHTPDSQVSLNSMFGLWNRRKPGAEPTEQLGGVNSSKAIYVAAEHTQLPLSNYMLRLVAQELPFLSSEERSRMYQIFHDYQGPTITSQEELPAEIREILDL